MKQILLKVLGVVIMMASSFPMWSIDIEIEGITYRLDKDGNTATVCKPSSAHYQGNLMIPSTISLNGIDYSVVGVESSAFQNSPSLISVKFPETVTSLPSWAFYDCKALRTVELNDHFTNISSECFMDCPALTNFVLPSSIISIGERAFQGCSSMVELIIPRSVTKIDKSAFVGCTAMSSLIIEDSETTLRIGYGYYGGTNKGAFDECPLFDVYLGRNVSNLYTSGVYSSDAVFAGHPTLSSVTIGSKVTNLKEGLFANCTSLQSVSNNSLDLQIGASCFCGCKKLTEVLNLSKVKSIGRAGFKDCPKLKVAVLTSITHLGEDAFYAYDGELKEVFIGDSLAVIPKCAFLSQENLEYVYLGSSITTIEERAFDGAKSLNTIYVFSNKLTSVADNAFTKVKPIFSVPSPSLYDILLASYTRDRLIAIDNADFAYSGKTPSFTYRNYVPNTTISFDECNLNINAGAYNTNISIKFTKDEWFSLCEIPAQYTITPAPLTIIANEAQREYRQENPEFSCTYVGFKNNETEEVLTDKPTLATTANLNSIPGTYPIIPSSASAQNYTFSYERGTLTVTKAKNQLTWDQHIPAMEIGDNFALGFDVYEVTGEPSFSQYDSSVISIYKDGETWYVKALAPGKTNLAIQYVGNDYYETSNLVSKTITVNKAPDVPAESISLNKISLSLTIGTFETLTAMVSPDNTTDKTVVWGSNDESIAKVSSEGNVMGVGLGTTYITATCGDAKATCAVTVLPVSATNVFLDKTSLDLLVDDTYILRASVIPEGTTDKTVLWSTSNETVASVSSEGLVSAVGAGTAEVTARCGDATAKCLVTVNKHLQNIRWTQDLSNVKEGEDFELTATASSGLPVEYEIRTGLNIASIKDDILLSTSHGKISVAAAQRGDDKYAEAEEVVRTIVIQQTSGISLVNSDDKYVRIEGSSILTSGNIEIVVYEINGNLLYKGKDHVVKLQPQTIYILTYEGNSVKFVAR